MSFTPSRGQAPSLIPQDLLVQKSVIKSMKIMLQPNTPNSGIDCTLPQRFDLLPIPKANKNSQQELVQASRAHPTHAKDTKLSIP